MKKNIKLPFTINMSGGNKDSFKILNNKEISKKIQNKIQNKIKNNNNIMTFIKKMFVQNNTNKIQYIKASTTKEYYKKINSKKKIK
jgi:hypothetical protein